MWACYCAEEDLCVRGLERTLLYVPLGGVHFKAVGSMVLPWPRLVSLAFQSSIRSYRKNTHLSQLTQNTGSSSLKLKWQSTSYQFGNVILYQMEKHQINFDLSSMIVKFLTCLFKTRCFPFQYLSIWRDCSVLTISTGFTAVSWLISVNTYMGRGQSCLIDKTPRGSTAKVAALCCCTVRF